MRDIFDKHSARDDESSRALCIYGGQGEASLPEIPATGTAGFLLEHLTRHRGGLIGHGLVVIAAAALAMIALEEKHQHDDRHRHPKTIPAQTILKHTIHLTFY